jgi:hypothetical protein
VVGIADVITSGLPNSKVYEAQFRGQLVDLDPVPRIRTNESPIRRFFTQTGKELLEIIGPLPREPIPPVIIAKLREHGFEAKLRP